MQHPKLNITFFFKSCMLSFQESEHRWNVCQSAEADSLGLCVQGLWLWVKAQEFRV